MLIWFLFLLLGKSIDPQQAVPKLKFLWIYGDYSDEEISQMQKENEDRYKENMEECKETTPQNICEMIYSMLDYTYSNGKRLDNDLQNIASDTDLLLVTISRFTPEKEIDLNILKGSMVVYLACTSSYSKILSKEDKQNEERKNEKRMIRKLTKFLNENGDLRDTQKFIQTLFPKKNKNTKALLSLPIVGGIKSKIPFLYVANCNVKIVKSDLDCFYSSFIACTFDSESKKIKSTYLLVDRQSHNSLNIENVDVNQYTLYLLNINTNYDSAETYYRVSYWKEQWRTYFKSTYSGYYSNLDLNVPYTSAKSFGIIVVSLNIDIYRDDSDVLASVKDVNVSVLGNFYVPSGSKILDTTEKKTISITATGWEGQSSKPKVVVTTDKNAYKVDSSKAGDLNVEVQEQYVYKPKAEEEKKKKTNVGLIVGVVVGVVVVVVVVIIIVVVVVKKKKNKVNNSSDE